MQLEEQQPLIFEFNPRLSAPQCFELFHKHPFSFFLDSGMGPTNLGRYSFMGSDPFLVVKSRASEVSLCRGSSTETREGNPFNIVAELLETYTVDSSASPVPFVGGAVGYFSYDLCHHVEDLSSTATDDLGLPECYLAFYDCVVAFDHVEGKAYIISTGFPELDEDRRMLRAKERLDVVRQRLSEDPPAACLGSIKLDSARIGRYQEQQRQSRCNFSREAYVQAVQSVREYIAAGDVFQVNLSQRFEADLPMPPFELYERLREINPAPFAAYLDFDEVKVLSASPERFLRVEGGLVETRPMKGTRPRGSSPAEDEALGAELVNSIKDRAENVMIVDLERNDLGRVCQFGTVKVRDLYTLEKYATVFQLTSTIEGRLLPDKTRFDLLKGCFPGGSITGAPKVRAMEIIDELEPTRRSVYTGGIGYLSFGGEMDLNMAIRTILVKECRAYFQVGGGITYSSDPEAEYQETMDKAKALLEALNLSSEVAAIA